MPDSTLLQIIFFCAGLWLVRAGYTTILTKYSKPFRGVPITGRWAIVYGSLTMFLGIIVLTLSILGIFS